MKTSICNTFAKSIKTYLDAGLCSTHESCCRWFKLLPSSPLALRSWYSRNAVVGTGSVVMQTWWRTRFEPRALNLRISSISKEGSSALCWQPARTVRATGTRWYGPAGSAFCYYVVRLYSWYNSYRMVTEARSPSLKADNLNHVAVDSWVEHNPA